MCHLKTGVRVLVCQGDKAISVCTCEDRADRVRGDKEDRERGEIERDRER